MKNIQIDKEELKLANAFLNQNFERIINWSIGDIKKSCRLNDDGTCDDNGALVGAFILWCCALDYFGGLFTGNPSNGGTKERIRVFIFTYMKQYDYEKIYDLRWSLLHYYSPHHFVLYHENNLEKNRRIHLTTSNRGIMLHLGCAIIDLENAVNQYKTDLEINDLLKMKAWKYYKKQYPIIPLEVREITEQSKPLPLASTGYINVSGTANQDYWLRK